MYYCENNGLLTFQEEKESSFYELGIPIGNVIGRQVSKQKQWNVEWVDGKGAISAEALVWLGPTGLTLRGTKSMRWSPQLLLWWSDNILSVKLHSLFVAMHGKAIWRLPASAWPQQHPYWPRYVQSFEEWDSERIVRLFYILIWTGLLCFADLVSQNIEVTLSRRTNMESVIKIIEENIPEVLCILWMLGLFVKNQTQHEWICHTSSRHVDLKRFFCLSICSLAPQQFSKSQFRPKIPNKNQASLFHCKKQWNSRSLMCLLVFLAFFFEWVHACSHVGCLIRTGIVAMEQAQGPW